MRTSVRSMVPVAMLFGLAVTMLGQQAPTGYDDTPMQPNGKWRIHDGKRPQPPIVTPGRANPAPLPGPSDAIALLGAGSDLGAWKMTDGSPATWVMKEGIVETGKGMM